MRRLHISVAAAACALLALAACVSTPAPRQTIAVVGVPEPAKLSVLVENHPDAGASQTRGLFFAAAMQTLERELADSLKPRAFAPGAALSEALAESLRRPDRAVVRVANPQQEREDFLKDYPAPETNTATIFVDVIPRAVGYWAEAPMGSWHPWVVVAYRVYDSRAGKVVASGQISTGPPPPGEASIALAADRRYAFPSFEAVIADPARAEAGIAAAMRLVAQAVAQRV